MTVNLMFCLGLAFVANVVRLLSGLAVSKTLIVPAELTGSASENCKVRFC